MCFYGTQKKKEILVNFFFNKMRDDYIILEKNTVGDDVIFPIYLK